MAVFGSYCGMLPVPAGTPSCLAFPLLLAMACSTVCSRISALLARILRPKRICPLARMPLRAQFRRSCARFMLCKLDSGTAAVVFCARDLPGFMQVCAWDCLRMLPVLPQNLTHRAFFACKWHDDADLSQKRNRAAHVRFRLPEQRPESRDMQGIW